MRMLDDMKDFQEVAFTQIADVPLNDLTQDLQDSQIRQANATVTLCSTKETDGKITQDDATTKPTLQELTVHVGNARAEREISKGGVLFIAIAWIVIPAFCFLMLCPDVIWCDVTYHSNNKGFHLFTLSCRTSVDKQVVFMWIWLPNKKRFSFRWVFQFAILNLIPLWLRERVTFLMKDGDPQQRNEILYSMIDFFPNAKEGGCGFHIGTYFNLLRICLCVNPTIL